MKRITVAAYRLNVGKESQRLELVKEHLPVLKSQDWVTRRRPVVMPSGDNVIMEAFGWKSADAIKMTRVNAEVQKFRARFGEVCDYNASQHQRI